VVLGQSAGLTDEQMQHLTDDPLPDGLYSEAEEAIIEYSHHATRLEPIDDELYGRLQEHFSQDQIMEICMLTGLSNLVNRYHLTFHTDLDDETERMVAPTCRVPMPAKPAHSQ
jgi:alkylhydroperoxidase family enzyme